MGVSDYDLFADAPVMIRPDVLYLEGCFRGRWTLEQLEAVIPLKEPRVAFMYGKAVKVPRLEAWYGLRPYDFGGRVEEPLPWPQLLLDVKAATEAATGAKYDSCFANLYRDGNDTIPWHADDSDWIVEPIASVTFGAARRFAMRHNLTKTIVPFFLGDGDVLLMRKGTQAAWQHSVPRTEMRVGRRLNLTFRGTRV